MKKTLDFVKGAVSTKDLVPVLANFHFYAGRVQGGNGRVTIDAPLDLGGVDITVPAVPFLRAVEACGGEPQLNITEGGRLTMKRGKFRSTLPLSNNDDFPRMRCDLQEMGQVFESKHSNKFLEALQLIRPFIGADASRPWACGVLLKDGYLHATNNVVIVRVPINMPWESSASINIPSYTVDEILRINKIPTYFAFNDHSIALVYGSSTDASWLRSNLFEAKWPDVDKFFEGHDNIPEVPSGMLSAVQKVLPFCPDSRFPAITLDEEGVHTADGDMSAGVGGLALPPSKYRAEPLQLVLSHATHIDLTKYPKPVPFTGEGGLQGVMIGVKQ